MSSVSQKFDPNLFYDSQFNNNANTWELLAAPWSEEGVKVQELQFNLNTYCSILKGIITDTEFGVDIAHDFSSPEGGLVGSIASKINGIKDNINSMSSQASLAKGLMNDIMGAERINKMNQATRDFFGGLIEGGGRIYDNISNKPGSVFTTAFDYTRVFKGTNISVEFPALESRIYHRTMIDIDESRSNAVEMAPISTKEYMSKLIRRLIGPLQTTGSGALDSVLGIQAPPNDYEPSFQLINTTEDIKGTFVLRYGPYTIRNLLVSSFSMRPSTFKVRENTTGSGGQLMVSVTDQPIYVDVRVTVQPCTYISRDTLMELYNLISYSKT